MEKCKYCILQDEDGFYAFGKCTCPNKHIKGKCLIQMGKPCTYYEK